MDIKEDARRFLGKYSDQELLKEKKFIDQVMELDDWYDTLLQEDIDALYEAVLEECSERFVCIIRNRSEAPVVEMKIVK